MSESTANTISQDENLTLEKLKEAVKLLNDQLEIPWIHLFCDNGFNPDEDIIIFNDKLKDKFSFIFPVPDRFKDRVKFDDSFLDDNVALYMVRASELPQNKIKFPLSYKPNNK